MVTMRDVAALARVSITTVSHVINDTRPVSEQLRIRVQEAMETLGYQPNTLARSLRRGKSHTVGVIIPDSANPFFAEVARGIEDASFDHAYSVILCNSDHNLDKERLYTNVLVEKQVDGILFVAAGLSSDNLQSLQAREIPLVVVDRKIEQVTVDTVIADNQRGGWLATEHLVELGHCRIGCISGPSEIRSVEERLSGYRQALSARDLSFDEQLIVRGDFHFESGFLAGERLLGMDDPPTAIFACNDLMAVGALACALEKGLRVPEDLSIVGFDDVRLTRYTNPPMTTVRQPKYEMGALAMEMLMERINDRQLPQRVKMLATRLVIRQTTGPARSG